VERLRVLAAALALQDFTVDEISGLSGVNENTVRSVLKREARLLRRADERDDAPIFPRGRGRPAKRWVVVDSEMIRKLIDALPKFEPNYGSLETDDWRSVAVEVAEDALAQASDESDPMLLQLLFSSAQSSLRFAENASPETNGVPWWQTEDGQFAVRARGVDALASLAGPVTADERSSLDVLWDAARLIAAAMQAVPHRGEAKYFAPLTKVLAHSGKFAPMYLLSVPEQEPLFPLVDDWTEVTIPDFHVDTGRVFTQVWAKPLVNVSISMPVVVSSGGLDKVVEQMIETIKTVPRPAVVFGPPDEGTLIKSAGRVGASFVPIDETIGDKQGAIDSLVAAIDRFSVGR
jgi:hypothetical protein